MTYRAMLALHFCNFAFLQFFPINRFVKNVHISEELKGGGFIAPIACNRAIQEAFSCLLD